MNGLQCRYESSMYQSARTHTYENVIPTYHTMGKYENARAAFVSSVISPRADLRTPMFPFSAPASARLATRLQKDRDRPKQTIESVRPSSPQITTGRRPSRSLKRP